MDPHLVSHAHAEPSQNPLELPLWSIQKDGQLVACVLRDRGASGVEARILVDGDLRAERRFASAALAVRWAGPERVRNRRARKTTA